MLMVDKYRGQVINRIGWIKLFFGDAWVRVKTMTFLMIFTVF